MRLIKTILYSSVTVFVLAFLLGSVSIYTLTLYNQVTDIKKQQTAQNNIGYYKRFIRIENIDVENNVIGAVSIDRDVYQVNRMLFSVTETTRIERQEPILDNDVIVGFTPVTKLSISDLAINDKAIVRVSVSAEGKLIASNILLGVLSSSE